MRTLKKLHNNISRLHKVAYALFLILSACTVTEKPFVAISTSSSIQSTSQSSTAYLSETYGIPYLQEYVLKGTDLELVRILDDNIAYTRQEIRYKSNDLLISGILNIPKGKGPFPLIILNHGYIDPAVYTIGRGLKREQDYLAKEGFAVLHTDYRGHGASDANTNSYYDGSLGYTIDSLNAILAVKEANLPNVDTSLIGMLGHSMGGGVSLNAAVSHPELVDAIVLYAPVHAKAWQNFMRWRNDSAEGEKTLRTFGSIEQNPDYWNAISSWTYLENIDDPIRIFHGTSDDDVPYEWSSDLVGELQRLQKDVALFTFTNEEHEFSKEWNNFMRTTVDFFTTHLRQNTMNQLSIYDASRITKKDFGELINPETSKVPNDRFSGYHTGIDFEVFDTEDEKQLLVTALCDGNIVDARWLNGYGGVIAQSCTYNSEPIIVIYGHLNPLALAVQKGANVAMGDVLGTLGKGFTQETDGERAHLHLSVHSGSTVDFRGYVESESELQKWLDPRVLIMQ